jgi:hypothetical protein
MAPPPADEGGAGAGGRCGGVGARWLLVGLALGQFVSLLITSTGFASSELARRGAFVVAYPCRAAAPPLDWFSSRPTGDGDGNGERRVLLTVGNYSTSTTQKVWIPFEKLKQIWILTR